MSKILKEDIIKSNSACEPITSGLYNYFSKFKEIRELTEEEIINYFNEAFEEDKLSTLKLLFYLRDVRGGLGERRAFRVVLKYLGENYPEIVKANIRFIPYYGRWDDLYSLFYTDVEDSVIKLFRRTLKEDLECEKPSLLAKWMKSSNTTSKESRELANRTIKKIGLTHRQYRKTLSYLRRKINIVEINLSNRDFSNINYEEMPCGALSKYKKTFFEFDRLRYMEFSKINITNSFSVKEDKWSYEFMVNLIKSERYNLIKMV
ncbi:DUF2828 family protein [uncultured Clostridium sp.]|uniref:DUF2828 family protein n=1 Tax=uncultured Clostridium sp. TaxID=59620 RepID=UPI002634D507|nr:DUF2828 family protein [uncultured Clostridium sp.]